MRLAWFTPWPPQASGVAGRAAEIVPRLAAAGHGLDVFVDERLVDVPSGASAGPPAAGGVRVLGAHDFVWRHARGAYDLAVYQLGNSHLHAFIWPYLFRWPGLVVLHDARLHHARARALLARRRADEYRAEFAWNQPEVSPALAELAVHGFDGPYYYDWPMVRSAVAPARLVAVHQRGVAARLAERWPGARIEYVALGEGHRTQDPAGARARFCRAHGVPEGAVLFGAFGALTASKRIPQILRAFAHVRVHTRAARLILAGAVDPSLEVGALARALGVADAVHVLGPLNADAFDAGIAAVDVCLSLRWPTTLEVSGPWLRALAASRPTVIVDFEHQAHLPTLDPRTWNRHGPVGPDAAEAMAVAIDILDEDHSLQLAMLRLSADAALRARLGQAARRHWEREHTVERMIADYERVVALAAAAPAPAATLPDHCRPDPLAPLAAWTEAFGEEARHRLQDLAAS